VHRRDHALGYIVVMRPDAMNMTQVAALDAKAEPITIAPLR
jgi:hypothetical protein